MMSTRFTFLLLALTVLGSFAEAKVFRNSYVSFELPDRWNCTLEQTEYVCRSTVADGVQRQAATIILTAKEVGPQDSLTAYEAHLKVARQITSREGQPLQSQVPQAQINGQTWIDGMHLNSEIPNYFTRYLATTKDRIAVLVTFSAHQAHYSRFSSDFFRAIQSLRVIFNRSTVPGGNINTPGAGVIGSGGTGLVGEGDGLLPDQEPGGGFGRFLAGAGSTILGILLLAGAIGFYFWSKRKKGGGGRGGGGKPGSSGRSGGGGSRPPRTETLSEPPTRSGSTSGRRPRP
jgi:hypothetical protein